jgi:hypothetical protein
MHDKALDVLAFLVVAVAVIASGFGWLAVVLWAWSQ